MSFSLDLNFYSKILLDASQCLLTLLICLYLADFDASCSILRLSKHQNCFMVGIVYCCDNITVCKDEL